MTTATLTVTDAGLALAVNAAANGIKITLATFDVGSASGYTPLGTDTALHGSTLYTAAITAYANQLDGSMLINCTIPAQAGPFTFGEVGLRTDAGVLFALAALPLPQDKYPSLGSDIPTTFTFSLFLKLGRANAIFNILTTGAQQFPIRYVNQWADVEPASGLDPFPTYQQIVSEADNKGDYTVLTLRADNRWSVQSNYTYAGSAVLAAVGVTNLYVEITQAQWQLLIPGEVATTVANSTAHSFLFESSLGKFRTCTVSLSGSNVRLTFPSALTGLVAAQVFTLWCNNSKYISAGTTITRVSSSLLRTQAGEKIVAQGGLGTGNAVSATTPGAVIKKMEVFDASGNSLGFVPIYSSIA